MEEVEVCDGGISEPVTASDQARLVQHLHELDEHVGCQVAHPRCRDDLARNYCINKTVRRINFFLF